MGHFADIFGRLEQQQRNLQELERRRHYRPRNRRVC